MSGRITSVRKVKKIETVLGNNKPGVNPFKKVFNRFGRQLAVGALTLTLAAGATCLPGCVPRTIVGAARVGDLATVKELVMKGKDPNGTDWHFGELFPDKSALMYAAKQGDLGMAKFLLENGVDVNEQTNNGGVTALFFAVTARNVEMMELLIENGANIELGRMLDSKPLIHSVKKNNPELVKYLLEKGADPSVKDGWGVSPLMLVSCSETDESSYDLENNLEIIRLLLKHGADVNERSVPYQSISGATTEYAGGGKTPLMFASGAAALQKAKFLIENGADVNAQDAMGMTPLMHNRSALFEMMELLLENGADPTHMDKDGCSLFMHMVQWHKLSKSIMYQRPNWMLRNELGGKRPDPFKTIKFLLENEGNVTAQDKKGRTSLMLALAIGNWETAELLLDNGAAASGIDKEGNSTLLHINHLVFGFPSTELVNRLIGLGAEINAQNKFGETALHMFLFQYEFELVELAVNHGADLNLQDTWKRTPLLSFMERSSRLDVRDDPGFLEKKHNIIRFLLENSAEVNVRDECGKTALFYANKTPRDRTTIKLLEEYGAKE